jgi:hypothetical protein
MAMRNEAAVPARRTKNSRPAEKIAWDFVGCVFVGWATSMFLMLNATPLDQIGFLISQYDCW